MNAVPERAAYAAFEEAVEADPSLAVVQMPASARSSARHGEWHRERRQVKQAAVALVLDGGKTVEQAAEVAGVTRDTVSGWLAAERRRRVGGGPAPRRRQVAVATKPGCRCGCGRTQVNKKGWNSVCWGRRSRKRERDLADASSTSPAPPTSEGRPLVLRLLDSADFLAFARLPQEERDHVAGVARMLGGAGA